MSNHAQSGDRDYDYRDSKRPTKSDVLFIEFNEPVPTSPGLYLRESHSTDPDGRPSVDSCWFFIYNGELHAMPLGYDRGKPVKEFRQYFRDSKWSKRITRKMGGE